jgi:hypothetical protein
MSTPRSLLIVSFSRLVSDARLLKQIAAFSQDYQLTTCGYGPAPEGVDGHVQIPDEAVYWRYDKLRVVAKQYRSAYWTNPAVQAAYEALSGRQFDVVLANDVDTAGLALELGARKGVHLDLHEFAPLQNTEMLRFRLFVAPFLSWQLRRFASKATSTTTVCRSLAEKYESSFGFLPGVVTNAAPYAALTPKAVSHPLRVVHAGAALANRKLDLLVEAFEGLESTATLDLYLTPNDRAHLEMLRHRSDGMANVTFHDAVPYTELLTTLNNYDLGVHLLAPTNFNNRFALPNKFFDYVQARLGLIIGPSPEMARLLTEYDLGVITSDFTAEALRDSVLRISTDEVTRWKSNADASARELSAESQVEVWKTAIDAIARS